MPWGRARGGDQRTLHEWSDSESAKISTTQIILLAAALAQLPRSGRPRFPCRAGARVGCGDDRLSAERLRARRLHPLLDGEPGDEGGAAAVSRPPRPRAAPDRSRTAGVRGAA